jgi:hypothetical protein
MTCMTRRGTGRGNKWIGVLLSCVVLLPAAAAAQDDVNVVKSVKAVDSTIEIELNSSKEFPIRDEVVVLRIGNRDFLRSKSPDDGSLKTLIFILTANEFNALADGAAMTVRYGKRDPGEITVASGGRDRDRWDFGRLDKALLGR